MSLLSRLGLHHSDPPPPTGLLTEVKARLARLPEPRAEFVGAFAGLLVRVARADSVVSDTERDALRALIVKHAGLTAEESQSVADIVLHQSTVLAGIDYTSLARTFNEIATPADKEQLIDCLYNIAIADNMVSIVEDEEIRQVSRALLMTHTQFIAIRTRYRDKLELLQGMRARANN